MSSTTTIKPKTEKTGVQSSNWREQFEPTSGYEVNCSILEMRCYPLLPARSSIPHPAWIPSYPIHPTYCTAVLHLSVDGLWISCPCTFQRICQTRLYLQEVLYQSQSKEKPNHWDCYKMWKGWIGRGARSFAGRQKEELPQGPKYQSCIPLC